MGLREPSPGISVTRWQLLLIGALFAAVGLSVGLAIALGVALSQDDKDVSAPGEPPSSLETFASSTTTTPTPETTSTSPPTTTTSTTDATVSDDFLAFQASYGEGYEAGYEWGLGEGWDYGGLPDGVWETYESPASTQEYGWAAGFIDGFDIAWRTVELQMAQLQSADTQSPTPTIYDRGYEQGKEDGYTAGNADGQRGTWQANWYVQNQGPEYARGFYEAYDYWYSYSNDAVSNRERSQVLMDSLTRLDCMMGGGSDC